MSTTTFKLVAQKLMGKMKPTHRKELSRIETRRAELVMELETLDTEQQTIIEKTTAHLKIDMEGPFRGLHLDDDGGVHALYCTCAPCQANLNNTTVLEATQIMIERGFIHADQAAVMLQRAEAMDKQHGTSYVH
jgi:hypothetical protein